MNLRSCSILPSKKNKGVSKRRFDRLQRAYYDLLSYLCGGNPGPKGTTRQHQSVALKALRKTYRQSGVKDGKVTIPTSWYDLRILGYLVRGVPYDVACEQAERLMDMENPADLDEEARAADKEGLLNNLGDIIKAGSLKEAGYEIKDTFSDLGK